MIRPLIYELRDLATIALHLTYQLLETICII